MWFRRMVCACLLAAPPAVAVAAGPPTAPAACPTPALDDSTWAGVQPSLMFKWPPIPEDPSLRLLRYDRKVVALSKDCAARRVRGRRGTWAVDQVWFASPGVRDRVFFAQELMTLAQVMNLSDDTQIEWITGRFLVHARRPEHLAAAVRERLARGAPDSVLAYARTISFRRGASRDSSR